MVNVASTDRLKNEEIYDNGAQPSSFALARGRQDSVDAAAALIEAEHIAAVKSEHVNIDTRKINRITSLPPTKPNRALASQQVMRSVNQVQTDLMISDSSDVAKTA